MHILTVKLQTLHKAILETETFDLIKFPQLNALVTKLQTVSY